MFASAATTSAEVGSGAARRTDARHDDQRPYHVAFGPSLQYESGRIGGLVDLLTLRESLKGIVEGWKRAHYV